MDYRRFGHTSWRATLWCRVVSTQTGAHVVANGRWSIVVGDYRAVGSVVVVDSYTLSKDARAKLRFRRKFIIISDGRVRV